MKIGTHGGGNSDDEGDGPGGMMFKDFSANTGPDVLYMLQKIMSDCTGQPMGVGPENLTAQNSVEIQTYTKSETPIGRHTPHDLSKNAR